MRLRKTCEHVEESGPRKTQEDWSGNCDEHLLHLSVGIQKGPQEHLLNYDKIRDEISSRQRNETDPVAAE